MIGIIGGTGLNQLDGCKVTEQTWHETPFGEPSSVVSFAELHGHKLAFLARHGVPHKIAPHQINYRANLFALKEAGVESIIAINAVGGIHTELGPTALAIPDQIIDYTYGRESTIYDGCHTESLDHIDFSFPYCADLREQLLDAATLAKIDVLGHGTYGATQGPRLETAAEILRMKQDGCDMVGMTGMPEASLAKELGMRYACLALSVNWAAGITENTITMKDIENAIHSGIGNVHRVLAHFFK